MKKTIFTFVIGLIMMLSFSSCDTAVFATTQDDIYTETTVDIARSTMDFDAIVRYGTPYYHNGSILYYMYDSIYYYPFYYNDCWYVRAYRYPFSHLHYHPYFRPHRYDYRLGMGYLPRHNWYRPKPRRPHYKRHIPKRIHRPNSIPKKNRPDNSKGKFNNGRPGAHQNTPSHARPSQPRQNFGGSRTNAHKNGGHR